MFHKAFFSYFDYFNNNNNKKEAQNRALPAEQFCVLNFVTCCYSYSKSPLRCSSCSCSCCCKEQRPCVCVYVYWNHEYNDTKRPDTLVNCSLTCLLFLYILITVL